jgi:hypothetical protein
MGNLVMRRAANSARRQDSATCLTRAEINPALDAPPPATPARLIPDP